MFLLEFVYKNLDVFFLFYSPPTLELLRNCYDSMKLEFQSINVPISSNLNDEKMASKD